VLQIYVICGQIHPQITQILIILFNCAFDRTPKLISTAAAFGRVGHYAVVIEHACNALQILSQLVVRKLIGFRGNDLRCELIAQAGGAWQDN